MTDPVVQAIDESNGEIVYTLRIKGTTFRPKVFRTGSHTIKVGEPGTEKMKALKSIRTLSAFVIRVAILVRVPLLVVAVSRGFCPLLCPLGAILSVFNRISLFRIWQTKENCNDCGLCATDCPVEIHPVTQMNSPECIRRLKCTSRRHLKLGVK
jgi:Pyruvate/2-oxoacid:ferredoxin oxidoreductase delta subunit